jgi:hypothetical protein
MLLQPKCSSPPPPAPHPQTKQSTAHKRENRPMKLAKENSEDWFITPKGRILIAEKTAPGLVRLAHDITHLGKTSLQITQMPGHSPISDFNSVGQQVLPALRPT